ALVNRTYENSVKSKEPYTIQHRLLMRDGRIKYVKEEAVTLYCIEGEPILSQGTIQDITQTVLLQESILNERNFANALIDNANSIVVVFDIEGRLVRLNQYGLEFVKYTQEELSKEPYAWLKLIPKGVLSEVKSVFDKAINGDLMKRHQNKWMSKEGEERYFEWSNALVFDPKGAIEYIVSIGTDISDRIRIEEDLLKADKDNKKQLEVIDQHVLAMHLDQKGITLSASTAFAELIGYDKSEIVGLRLKHIKAFRNHDLLNDLHEKDHKTVELELLSKSKDQIWLEAMIATEYNEDEKIRGLNIFFQDITDKKKIEELTHYDHLTKIFNRRKMDIVLSEEIERHQRYGSELSLIMIDLDYFKEVNDKFGHQVGDAVLEGAANILKENIRKTDALGRIGGEEFLIVCPQTSLQQCKILATKIKETIESFDFEIAGKKTASIGVTTIKNFDTKDSFFKRADEAMYEAKREGRNQVRVK
ncbi:MAG: diguanylate cyclase, partial [Thiovulaceae bacterium]|nr:diguanylate cyclase [Sulfurimonadaceae bacterium]